MRRWSFLLRALVLGAVACFIALPAVAQNPTGTLTGRATQDGQALPGVTVRATSPALPGGAQVAVTGASGDYILRFLPPGTYDVSFTLAGFATLETQVKISVDQNRILDAEMQEAKAAEEIVVTGAYETMSATSKASVTFVQDTIEKLPVPRDIQNVALLAPGVKANASNVGAVNIGGAPGPQSLFMINGVEVNDTIWGNPFPVYVEDAVEETTVNVSGVSAEYGRFVGGVINMVTKSGGNQFSGSYRLNLENDNWQASTPLTTAKENKINRTHEATLGGYVMKDHLWFFMAGRAFKRSRQDQMWNETPYPNIRDQKRYEGKLTIAPTISHRILGSYMKVDDVEQGRARLTPIHAQAIIDRETPNEMFAVNYTGVITEKFFVEGQYAERDFQFVGSGGDYTTDVAAGTSIIHWYQQAMGNTHIFCNGCPGGDESRNNEDLLAKGSLFFSSGSLGSHDLVFGYDTYNDVFLSNNYQSPSNFRVDIIGQGPTYGPDGVYYPMITPGYGSEAWARILYWPILALSRGTDFKMNSLFVNDTWRLNNHWTFNIGARYDKNDSKDGSGNQVSKDSRLSPRLGLSWDPNGDGDWIVNASYGRYVAMLDAGEGASAGGGNASFLGWLYDGAPINVDENGDFVPMYDSYEAMQIVLGWLDSIGGISNTANWLYAPSLSGYNLEVPALKSPYTDEFTIGVLKRLGSKGMVRADYVYRDSGDFYISRTDLNTGQVNATVEIAPGVTLSQDFDLTRFANDSATLKRTYHGIHTQFQYRFSDRLQVGGNYTWSHLYGNFDGENTSNGITVSGIGDYPEYIQERWNYPSGDLAQDQRHSVALYAVWDPISTPHHNLTVSWLERYQSGTPYNATISINPLPYVTNPGYLTPSGSRTYFVRPKGYYTSDDVHSSDLAVNYSFFANLFGAQVELYVQPEVQNLFNEAAVLTPNNSVTTTGVAFNPFTENPVEGTHYVFDSNFGNADIEDDYQLPRRFRVSFGVRF